MDDVATSRSMLTEGMAAKPPRARPPSADTALLGIYEISKILTAPARLEQTLGNVVAVLSSFLDMKLGMITILDQHGNPEIVATSGWTSRDGSKPIDTLPAKVIDRLVATAMPVIVEDVSRDALFATAAETITRAVGAKVSFLAVAIKSDSRVVGTLSINRTSEDWISYAFDADLRLLTMIANLIGQTVKLHRMFSADRQRLLNECSTLEKALVSCLPKEIRGERPDVAGIIGESPAIMEVLDTIAIVAKSNSTVLLRGESGTGKELFARAVHDLSRRSAKPFVKLNCAALPESVLESELFGHERGAFTGAVAQRAGRFELANGGTLLLDEIGEISPAFQAKLLRVLQEGEFERVGGSKTLKVNVRFVFATNKNLEEAVEKGEFRADLYYRISVVPVFLPPLRERPGDVSLLAQQFHRDVQQRKRSKARTLGERHRDAATLLLPGQRARTGKLRAPHGDFGARRNHRRSRFRLRLRQMPLGLAVDQQRQRRLSACASRTGRHARRPLRLRRSRRRAAAQLRRFRPSSRRPRRGWTLPGRRRATGSRPPAR